MPQFMDVHSGMTNITLEQLRSAHERDLQLEKQEGVHFIKAWADPKTGKVFCLSEAPDREAVLRVHAAAGHATDEIYEVPFTVE